METDTTPRSRSVPAVAGRTISRPRLGGFAAQLVAVAPLSIVFVVVYGLGQHALWYLAALAGILGAQQLLAVAARRAIGPERPSPADLLTLARAAIGAALVALIVARFSDRLSLVGALAWLGALVGATVLDWLDGPLARRHGPTRLGGVLDIEADSWLTLACALAAVTWGNLPWWVLVPPLVRYVHPARALVRGALPSGGGPWWSRATGVAQMALLLAALAPVTFAGRASLLMVVALPVSAAQLATLVALLFVRSTAR